MTRKLLAFSSVVLACLNSSPTQAAVFTWTGAGANNSWSTLANWQGGVAPPANTTDTVVEFAGTTRLTNDQNIANKLALNGVIFAANAGNNLVGGFNLTGMPISLVADAGNNPKITNNTTSGAAANTISLNAEFQDPTTITGNGTSNLVLSGALAGGSGFTMDSGNFSLVLSGTASNGYGGTTTVNSGTVILNKGANGTTAIPGDLVIGNGAATSLVEMRGFSQQIGMVNNGVGNSNVTIARNGTLRIANSFAANTALVDRIATLSGAGNVELGTGTGGGQPGRNTLFTGGKGADSPFSGTISGTGNLVKLGGNVLVLSGQNTYTGSTTVGFREAGVTRDGGVLTVTGSIGSMANKSGAVTVLRGTLDGNGTIFTAGPTRGVTIDAGGKIKPKGGSPGILTIGSGGFAMLDGSEFEVEIDRGASGPVACNGAGCYSQLRVVDGTILEGGALTLVLDSGVQVGDLFAIIDNLDDVPVTGTFASLAQGATFHAGFDGFDYLFQIGYDGNAISPSQVSFTGGNDVVLRVIAAAPVPEPAPMLSLLVGLGALFGALRTRRSSAAAPIASARR